MGLRLYSVELRGLGACTPVNARSPSAAKAEVWRSDVFCDMTFVAFLTHYRPKVRLAAVPAPDGYDYVRRAYGLDVTVGQRVLVNDGPGLKDAPGTVLYPGRSTAHVIVALDGWKHPACVHPNSVSPAEPEEA